MRPFALAAVITAAVLAIGVCRIADLDFWWHLRTGQLIVEEKTIPRHDVFSFTALGHEYVDHEWLFQVVQFSTYRAGGPLAIALLKCALIAATLIIVALYCVRRGAPPVAVLGLVLLAIGGGVTRMIERPELFSTLFAVITYVLAEKGDRRSFVLLPPLCLVWANFHAAVIVGFVIQAAFLVSGQRKERAIALVGSVVASCVNPFGVRVLTVPFELTKIINSGVINNEEWRMPTLSKVPFYFVALVVTVVLMLLTERRRIAPILVALFLAFISLRYIRNVGLFCTFMPMLVAPAAARAKHVLLAIGAVAFLTVATILYPFQRGVGEASYFPDRIASFIQQNDLQGRMINSYGMGGYLIWRLFPERLVFLDGRNEVFLPLLHELKAARSDSRAWSGLLNRYGIEYAVLDYVDELDRVLTMSPDGRVTPSLAPISATRFPRSRWALVHWDDDGMLFVRRAGRNAAVIAREYRSIFPEGFGYQQQVIANGSVSRANVIAELERKLAEDPSCRRARAMLAAVRSGNESRP